jgi:hypothetical protein
MMLRKKNERKKTRDHVIGEDEQECKSTMGRNRSLCRINESEILSHEQITKASAAK